MLVVVAAVARAKKVSATKHITSNSLERHLPRALRPNWLCESQVQPWRGIEPVAVAGAPEQARAVLAGTQLLPLLLLLRLLLSVSRGANFSNPNCCHSRCRCRCCCLLPRVVCFGAAIWFAAADAFKFNSQRKCLGKRKKKCASQIGHGAKALARALAHSTQIWPTARFKCAAVDLSYT